jgi:hypothetical protein
VHWYTSDELQTLSRPKARKGLTVARNLFKGLPAESELVYVSNDPKKTKKQPVKERPHALSQRLYNGFKKYLEDEVLEPGFLFAATHALCALGANSAMSETELRKHLVDNKDDHDDYTFDIAERGYWISQVGMEAALGHVRDWLGI